MEDKDPDETDSSKIKRLALVTMKNGDEYTVVITQRDSVQLTITSNGVEIRLNVQQIKKTEYYDTNEEFTYPNPHPSRYFFCPSAIPLASGTGYYRNLMLTTISVFFGIGNHFTLGIGMELISSLFGRPTFFISPKWATKVAKNFHLGFGALGIALLNRSFGNRMNGIGFALATYGTNDDHMTMGIGITNRAGEFGKNPAFTFSGQVRAGNNIGIMTENYFFISENQKNYLGIYGVRLMSRKNAFDIGLLVSKDISQIIPALPFVGYSRKF